MEDRLWEDTEEEKVFPCTGVYKRWRVICVPLRKVCEVIIWHPSCLCWSVQLRLAYKEDKSTVNMILNLQIFLLFFLPRLYCVFVTANSGDLFGNSCFCVFFAPSEPCVRCWFVVCVTMVHLHVHLLVCIMTIFSSVAQEHITSVYVLW